MWDEKIINEILRLSNLYVLLYKIKSNIFDCNKTVLKRKINIDAKLHAKF